MANEGDEIIIPGQYQGTVSFQPVIPDEIIFEILSRLPVRSLLRFKPVSKSWYQLISSAPFIDCNLQLSAADPDLSRHVIIFKSKINHNTLTCCPLSPVLNNHPTDAVDLDCCLTGVDYELITVLGCCNGLVCLTIDIDRALLWNPATRKSYELPKPNSYSSELAFFARYGFGYDKRSNDYKVVAFITFARGKRIGPHVTQVEVYSWRTGCWKRIQDFPGCTFLSFRSTFVNGCVNKLGIRKMSVSVYIIIVSLNLATEMFTEMPLPPALAGRNFEDMTLGALGERVCLFYNCGESRAEFWVMNEYGVKESWTKLASVSFLRSAGQIQRLIPLFISCTEEILMEYKSHDKVCLALHDVKNDTFKYPEVRNIDDLWEANIYFESLVSPRGDNRSEMPQQEQCEVKISLPMEASTSSDPLALVTRVYEATL